MDNSRWISHLSKHVGAPEIVGSRKTQSANILDMPFEQRVFDTQGLSP